MITWEPHWRAEIDTDAEEGKGLLSAKAHAKREACGIDSFSVFVLPCQVKIVVNLNTGAIFFNDRTVKVLEERPEVRLKLVWRRLMQTKMFTMDKVTNGKADCKLYEVGYVHAGVVVGYRIFPDGRLEGM